MTCSALAWLPVSSFWILMCYVNSALLVVYVGTWIVYASIPWHLFVQTNKDIVAQITLHANILLFDVCRIASDSWAHWVHSCNDRFLKSLNSSGSHSISIMCRPELGWYFDVLVVPVCRLLVRTSMLRRVRANGHLGLFLMSVWSGLQLETDFLVPWRYLSTYFFVHILIARFTSVRICSLFGVLSSPVLV